MSHQEADTKSLSSNSLLNERFSDPFSTVKNIGHYRQTACHLHGDKMERLRVSSDAGIIGFYPHLLATVVWPNFVICHLLLVPKNLHIRTDTIHQDTFACDFQLIGDRTTRKLKPLRVTSYSCLWMLLFLLKTNWRQNLNQKETEDLGGRCIHLFCILQNALNFCLWSWAPKPDSQTQFKRKSGISAALVAFLVLWLHTLTKSKLGKKGDLFSLTVP